MLWAPSHSGQLLSNWDTGWGCRESGIFSLPNTISMTWINYFTFLYFSFPLYIYLFCLLPNASATPLKISQPSCNEIIHLPWSCRSWTMAWVSPPFATCLSQVITLSLAVFITNTKELPPSPPSSESISVGKRFLVCVWKFELKPFPKIEAGTWQNVSRLYTITLSK